MNLNLIIFSALNSLIDKSPIFDTLISFLAQQFSYFVIAGAAIFLCIHKEIFSKKQPLAALARKFLEIFNVFVVALVSWILAHVFKLVFHTSRPLELLLKHPSLFAADGFAFPSGHATFFAALATAVLFYHRKAGIILWVCAVVISIARVIAGVHYPVDIAGGWILGSLVAFLFYRIFKQRKIA